MSKKQHETTEKPVLNRTELVAEVFAAVGERVPKTIIDMIIKAEEKVKLTHLSRGVNHRVQLIGFGTYEVRERSARKGRNPQTGEEIEIQSSNTIAFKPGKHAKAHVN